MKKYIILATLFLGYIISVEAQVGINTQTPKGLLHIDAGKNSPAITTDDILVKDNGYVGIGTITPSAKLDLEVPKGEQALRIVDGKEADSRVIVSDANGYGGWGSMRASGGQVIRLEAQTLRQGVDTKLKLSQNTRYNVTGPGNYLLFIRMWGQSSAVANNSTMAYFTFYKNGVIIDQLEYYAPVGAANTYFTISTVLAAPNCKEGDYLEVSVKPGASNWTLRSQANQPHTTSVLTMFMM